MKIYNESGLHNGAGKFGAGCAALIGEGISWALFTKKTKFNLRVESGELISGARATVEK